MCQYFDYITIYRNVIVVFVIFFVLLAHFMVLCAYYWPFDSRIIVILVFIWLLKNNHYTKIMEIY